MIVAVAPPIYGFIILACLASRSLGNGGFSEVVDSEDDEDDDSSEGSSDDWSRVR